MSRVKSSPLIQLVDEVSRLQGRFTSLFEPVQSYSGLKRMGDLVLNAVYEADSPPTVPQIGRSLGHPRQVIQRVVNELAADGLLERLPNPDHKRAPLLGVTDRGRALKETTDDVALDIANTFLQYAADAEECTRLARELRELRRALEAFARETQEADEA
ncbi:MarR family transcriptional regulator [Mangrovimicrobium sediminis]|uniref:MarR family transcriptional regulator n=1 Tax=Mangrovimicrobium sediminis TaxID=2562682 RepID=A0A4Z0LUW8_9GAMM|nr:helix-turn-helix domain-containing protein [Haliea sp. SAOS-164]TGD70997.1 MarR family transcriptional regulator [Haliea sp. SAOS-164]